MTQEQLWKLVNEQVEGWKSGRMSIDEIWQNDVYETASYLEYPEPTRAEFCIIMSHVLRLFAAEYEQEAKKAT